MKLAVISSVAVAAIVTVVLQPAPALEPVPLPRPRPVVDEVTRFGPVSEVPDWFKRVKTETYRAPVYAEPTPVYAESPPVYAKRATDPVCGARGRTHYRRDGWQFWRCNR
jgi:hypothetical protein